MTYMESFKQSIKNSDIKKAIGLLNQFKDKTYETKLELINELALAPDNTAFDLLSHLAGLKNHDKNIYDHIIQLVLDRAHLNFRFAIILYRTCEVKKIKGGVALMRYILLRSTDPEVIYETMVAAGQEQIEALVDDIAEYIYYDSTELKARAVKTLVQTGSDSAVQRLEQASTTAKCDKTILDALQLLKNREKSADKNDSMKIKVSAARENKTFLSLFAELRSLKLDTRFKAFNDIAGMMTSELNEGQAAVLSENLKSGDHDLKINTLRLIGETVQERLVPDIYGLLDQNHVDPEIKFAAFEALLAFPELDLPSAVVNGIEDHFMYVRMAAAKLLNKNASDSVCARIKERIESNRQRGEMSARTLIDVKAENIIDYLMVSDTFSDIASNYLSSEASPSSLKKYIQILRKRGLKSTTKKFEAILMDKKTDAGGPPAMVISPSSLVLDVHERIFFTGGYTSVVYKFCQDAFEALLNKKPAFILCDLFLDTMTGIDFVREIREFYPQDELCLIISSRQKAFTTASFEKESKAAGINAVIKFPGNIPKINSIVMN